MVAKISSRDSSVGKAMGWVARFLVPAKKIDFSPLQSVQTGSSAHPLSYPMSIGDSFPGLKRPRREADHSPPPSAAVKNGVELYLHFPYVFMARFLINQAQGQLYLFTFTFNG
jgi:hypothetical protein